LERGYSFAHELPPAFSPDYTGFLFSHPDHLKLQAPKWLSFYLLDKAKKKVLAQVSFCVKNKKAITPVRAPFGSLLFSERLSPMVLYDFVQHCEAGLIKLGAQSISITEPPLYYRKGGEILHTILLNLNYRVRSAELSTGIQIDDTPFEGKIKAGEKGKLKQGKTKGLQFKVLPPAELEKVYNFILKCGKQRGYSLSMTLKDLKKTMKVFNDSFYFFGTYFRKELAAASIGIKVHPLILYNFYSGHDKKFDSTSPIVLHTGGLYEFCRSHHFQLLDLGTSAIDGHPNFSLLDFKLRLGAVPSMKVTFEKELK
jgi:hypothetical protein